MMRAALLMRQKSGLALPVFGCTNAVYYPTWQIDIKQRILLFRCLLSFWTYFILAFHVQSKKKKKKHTSLDHPCECASHACLRVFTRDQTCPNCACLHLFTVPTCICTRLKSISRGVFSIVPACWSRDKAADHMLDSIGHRCARTDHRENVTACPQDVDVYF